MQQPLPLHRQDPHFRPTTVLLAALFAALVVACGLPAVANAVVPSFSLSEPANNLHVKNNLSINGYSSNVDIQAQCNLPNNAPGLTNFDCTYMNRWVSIGLSVFGPEGTRTLTVTATAQDGSGQQTVVNRTVIVDRTAPVTTISSGPSGGGYTGHDFTWNFSANETSVFWCRIDAEAWVSCTSPFTATGVADGSHTFDVRADDQAGNNGASASASFTVSNAPPQAGVAYVNGASVVGGQSNYVNSSTASWNLTSTRGDALLECSVDASPTWQACSTAVGFTVSGLTDGQHTLDVRAYLAGPTDVQDPPVRSTIVVDTIAPMLDFTSAKRDHAGTSATIDWGTSEQIVDSYCNIGPVSFHPCPTQFTDLAGGTHELVISVIDRAGNWSQDTAFTFRTYPSPPETTVSSVQSPTSPVAEARFTLSSSAAGSTFECRVDSAAFERCSSPASVAAGTSTAGSHVFEARATDPAGQTDPTPASTAFTLVQVDLPAPIASKVTVRGRSLSLKLNAPGKISAKVSTCKKSRKKSKRADCKKYTTGTAVAKSSGKFTLRLKRSLKKGRKYMVRVSTTSDTGAKWSKTFRIRAK